MNPPPPGNYPPMRRVYPHLILLLGVLIRLGFAPHEGHRGDELYFVRWADHVMTYGLADFYANSDCNYPPIWVYCLAAINHGARALGVTLVGATPLYRTLLKLPQILADVGIFYLIWWQFLCRRSLRAQVGWSAAIALNPALIFLSAIWCQVDSLMALPVVAAVVAYARDKPVLALPLLVLSLLVKPLALPLVPVLALVILQQHGWRPLVKACLAALATVVVVMLPVNVHESPLLLVRLFAKTSDWYPYSSMDAFNVWALSGFWESEYRTIGGVTHLVWGLILFGVAYAGVLALCWRAGAATRRDELGRDGLWVLLAAMTLAQLAFFLFPTKVQERYIYLPAVLCLLWAVHDLRVLPFALILTITTTLNVHYRVRVPGDRWPGMPIVAALHREWVTVALGLAANLTTFAVLFWRLGRNPPNPGEPAPAPNQERPSFSL